MHAVCLGGWVVWVQLVCCIEIIPSPRHLHEPCKYQYGQKEVKATWVKKETTGKTSHKELEAKPLHLWSQNNRTTFTITIVMVKI